ncbi:MAG: SGNH/GDSL hydrolase family protein [Clostridia bacterium]|nr:SGNH/GDSL hydrolase family protein [Clostridia bacterium]
MKPVALWGDSIGKGVVFDETRRRYVILKENCMTMLRTQLGIELENHSVMGCTAEKALERFNDDTLIPGGVAVIEFGGNDSDMPWADISHAPGGNYAPNSTVERFAQALVNLISRIRAGRMTPILVTPLPVVSKRYFDWVTRNLDAQAVLTWLGDVDHIYRWQERYAAAVRDVSRETQTQLLDLRDAFLNVGSLDRYFCLDGIHPNAIGHKLMFDFVLNRFIENSIVC